MEVAFAPGFLGGLDELPVVEAGAEAAGDGLELLGAVVVAEAIVGKAQSFWGHPAFAVILGEEGFDALVAVTGGDDLVFEVLKGDLGQDGVAKFGGFVAIDAPEAFWVQAS